MASDIVGQAPEIEVWITAVVQREYMRRDVFPKLRDEHARRFVNGATGVHLVSIEDAEALLDDAGKQLRDPALRRGVPVAFIALARSLRTAIKHAKGLWDDPGIEVARQRMEESPARFQVGDRVRWCSSLVDDPADGKELEIAGEYALRNVLCDKGEFVNGEGARKSYLWGYRVKDPRTGEQYFGSPFELQRMDYSRGYLCLVDKRPATKEGWRRHG